MTEIASSDLHPFHSILYLDQFTRVPMQGMPEYFSDLNLDQVVGAITNAYNEYELPTFFYDSLQDLDVIRYRQEIFKDSEDMHLMQIVHAFSSATRSMRMHLPQTNVSYYKFEKERRFLAAAQIYNAAINDFKVALEKFNLTSRGLTSFRDYLREYVSSGEFLKLASDTNQVEFDLAAVRYCVNIHEGRVTVLPYENQTDYSVTVEAIFARFQRGKVKNYLAQPSTVNGMNHIQTQIINGVAHLHPEPFHLLENFYAEHKSCIDTVISRFDREVQFYAAYLRYLEKFRRSKLPFCYPTVLRESRNVLAQDAFDLALASKLVDSNSAVVLNSFSLEGPERFIVVSGPNQGGKTTFARMFGQLHHLTSLGCPVPGLKAQLFHFDEIFTHFEKEEDIATLRGKLHDDLVRIHHIIEHVTPNGIVIMNEIFSSTTYKDAIYLSKQIMTALSSLDLLGVCVTFLDELVSFNEKTVSMVSTVDPADPTIRTYKLERRPADGLAYALAIAQKHHVTYAALKERIGK